MIKIKNNKREKEQLQRNISSILNEIARLPAHPNKPANTGPQLIPKDPAHRTANDNEGMLGAMMLESIIGEAFGNAANDAFGMDTGEFDLGSATDLYDEYSKDRAEGKGSLATTPHDRKNQPLKIDFHETAWDKYHRSLPARKNLEQTLKHMTDKLNQLHACDQYPELALA